MLGEGWDNTADWRLWGDQLAGTVLLPRVPQGGQGSDKHPRRFTAVPTQRIAFPDVVDVGGVTLGGELAAGHAAGRAGVVARHVDGTVERFTRA